MNTSKDKSAKRVFAALDIQNLWYAARNMGGNARVDCQKLSEAIRERFHGCTVDMAAYVVTSVNFDNERFIGLLRCLGCAIRERVLSFDAVRGEAHHADWDMGIAIEVMDKLHSGGLDEFVLVSGDGDYVDLVRRLQESGVRVTVYSFEAPLSRRLARVADEVIVLREDFLWGKEGA